MTRIVRTGTTVEIRDAPPNVTYSIRERFTFAVAGAEYSKAFQEKRWDGRLRLFRWNREEDTFTGPPGLFDEVVAMAVEKNWEHEVIEELPEEEPIDVGGWAGHPLRDYQEIAVEKALAQHHAILRMAIRSGKTLVAARMIHERSVRVLFVCPTTDLMHQTADKFRAWLPDCNVGRFGEGVADDHADVVVATLGTILSRGAPACTDLYVDEVHHNSTADAWREELLSIPCVRRYGLSATIDVSRKRSNETGAIWIRGLCGRIAFDVSASDLIEAGYLKRPTIHFVRYDGPKMPVAWNAKTIDLGIVRNRARNDEIVRVVGEQVALGRRVLIDVERIAHGRILTDALKTALGPRKVNWLCGTHPRSVRDLALKMLSENLVSVLVSTLFSEGTDVPELEVVIVAGGGKSDIATMQRLRNLTSFPGKGEVSVFDFSDETQQHLKRHTSARLAAYKREPSFRIVSDDRRAS